MGRPINGKLGFFNEPKGFDATDVANVNKIKLTVKLMDGGIPTFDEFIPKHVYVKGDKIQSGTEEIKYYECTRPFTSGEAFELKESASNYKAYSAAATYNIGDKVTQTKKHYICKTKIEIGEEFDPAKWTEVADLAYWKTFVPQEVSGAEPAYIIKQTGYNKYLVHGLTSGMEGVVMLVSGDETDGIAKPANVGEATLKTINVKGKPKTLWVSKLTNKTVTAFNTDGIFAYTFTIGSNGKGAFDDTLTTLDVFKGAFA